MILTVSIHHFSRQIRRFQLMTVFNFKLFNQTTTLPTKTAVSSRRSNLGYEDPVYNAPARWILKHFFKNIFFNRRI